MVPQMMHFMVTFEYYVTGSKNGEPYSTMRHFKLNARARN